MNAVLSVGDTVRSLQRDRQVSAVTVVDSRRCRHKELQDLLLTVVRKGTARFPWEVGGNR